MKKNSIHIAFVILCVFSMMITSCENVKDNYVDGYYTAEVDEFDDHGWKEYITICVSGGKIVTVEYNAKNPSGMIKAWDMNYMRTMNAIAGSYPNKYTRAYGGDLLKNQNADNIDAVSGATHSYGTFHLLADAVLDLAKTGSEQIVFVTAKE